MAAIHVQTLRRVSELIGDDRKLAAMLVVNEKLVARWKSERMPIPAGVFLKCVDILFSDAVRRMHPSDKDKPN
jgi:hypothetical protein